MPQSYGARQNVFPHTSRRRDARYAGLWMRVDAALQAGSTYPRVLAFDNMMDRPVADTNDWQREEVVLDVPVEGTTLTFGALLIGTGQVWADDFKLEVVGKDARPQHRYNERLPAG